MDDASVNASQEAAQPLSLPHTELAVCQGPHVLLSRDGPPVCICTRGKSSPCTGCSFVLCEFHEFSVNPPLQPGQIPLSHSLGPACTNCLSSENFSVHSAISSRSSGKTLQAPSQRSPRDSNVVKDFWIFPGWRFPAKSFNTWSLPQLAMGALFPYTSICMRASILTSEEIQACRTGYRVPKGACRSLQFPKTCQSMMP